MHAWYIHMNISKSISYECITQREIWTMELRDVFIHGSKSCKKFYIEFLVFHLHVKTFQSRERKWLFLSAFHIALWNSISSEIDCDFQWIFRLNFLYLLMPKDKSICLHASMIIICISKSEHLSEKLNRYEKNFSMTLSLWA